MHVIGHFRYRLERRVDLTLSGHTHYGQFAVPHWNWSLASVFLELAMGHYQRNDALLYIKRIRVGLLLLRRANRSRCGPTLRSGARV